MFTSDISKKKPETETFKAISIKISGHILAIPINAVFKVIRSSFVYSSLGENKLVYIEQQPLPLIDLSDILKAIRPNNNLEQNLDVSTTDEKFLVLAKLNQGHLSAIVVDEPPSLIELSLSKIYLLPPHQKQLLQNIASHIALVPDKNSYLSILLLDIHQALNAMGFTQNADALIIS